MSLALSPAGWSIVQEAIGDALAGGTLHLEDDDRTLVILTFQSPAFSAEGAAKLAPAYGRATGTPTTLRCVTKAGEVLLSGPSTLTLTPPEIIAGALVTVTGLTLAART